MAYLTFEQLCQELNIKVNRVTAWGEMIHPDCPLEDYKKGES